MDPGVYNITAYGYNATIAVNTTAIAQISIRNASASSISINYVCANETYATNNTNITVKMKATLQTISNFSNITIQTPTNGIANLSIDGQDRSGLTYTYHTSFRINETGTFNITGTVVDVANNIQSINSTFASFANGSASKTINLTGTNVQAFYLRDACTNDRIMAGNNFVLKELHHLEEDLGKRIVPFDEKLQEEVVKYPIARTLCTIPGVGIVTALTVIAEVDDFTRFPSGKHLTSFAGLVPRQRSSGETIRYGAITHAGSAPLRTVLVETAMRIRESNAPELFAFVKRLTLICGAKKARVALARKLLAIIWKMVISNTAYTPRLLLSSCTTNVSDLDTASGA